MTMLETALLAELERLQPLLVSWAQTQGLAEVALEIDIPGAGCFVFCWQQGAFQRLS